MRNPHFIDARGLSCPLPTLKLRRALDKLKAGDQIELHATDPMSAIDVPHFCTQNNHILIQQTQASPVHNHDVMVFLIKKGEG